MIRFLKINIVVAKANLPEPYVEANLSRQLVEGLPAGLSDAQVLHFSQYLG